MRMRGVDLVFERVPNTLYHVRQGLPAEGQGKGNVPSVMKDGISGMENSRYEVEG